MGRKIKSITNKMLYFIFFIVLISPSLMMQPLVMAYEATMPLYGNFNLHFENDWIESPSVENQYTVPDVDSIVDNISSFIQPGYSVYVGDQIPQENAFWKRHYRLTLTHIVIYDDHDAFDAGEIYVQGFVNQQIDDNMVYTEQFDIFIGSFNSGDEADENIVLYDAWAYDLKVAIEIYDEDPSQPDDSYGIWQTFLYWENATTIYVDYGDALVTYVLEVVEGPEITTAADLLDAYKPYLYSDVETTYDDPAEAVYGRVIEGYDEVKGYNTTCLQYLYFFPYEYTGDDDFVHYWDWEMILIFIDYSEGSRYPYRLVWDNGWYFSGESGYDWIDGQEFRIYDDTLSPATYLVDVKFSEQLWPLMGQNRNMQIKVYNISNVYDDGYENWGWFEWGMPTFQATIDTSYHQFDLGDPVGTDPMDMDRNYQILEFNDTVIRAAYKSLNTSFSEGVHELDGYYTPNYAPFSWDVMKPFEFPYIFNNYPKLAVDINDYNDAKQSKKFDYSIEKKIHFALDVPCFISTEIPAIASPGDIVNSNLTINLDESHAVVKIDVYFAINFTVDLFYFEHTFMVKFNESINYYVGTKELVIFGHTIDVTGRGNNDNEDIFNFEDVGLGNYITLGGNLHSGVVGTIFDMEISVSISEILKTLLGTSNSWIVDLIVDELDLIINPLITGYMNFDLNLGNALIDKNIELRQPVSTIPISFKMPEGNTDNLNFGINNLNYGINLAANWALIADWAMIPSIILDDCIWNFGTWPDIDINLAEGSATLKSIGQYEFDEKIDRWVLVSSFSQEIPNAIENAEKYVDRGIDAYPSIVFVPITVFSIIAIIKRKRYNLL